jgi:hypothetical protein
MKFLLDAPKVNHKLEITHAHKITLLGSCFSDEMIIHFKNGGFDVQGNPFGTIFHPLALSNIIESTLNQSSLHGEYYQRNDLFFSWLASGTFFERSIAKLSNKEIEGLQNLKNRLLESDFLVITLGTAWGYRLKTTNQLVANCHKAPSSQFTKELTDSDFMDQVWRSTLNVLLAINPNLKVVFTVSPVRHIKDGLVENTRSKARLVELVYRLENPSAGVFYFPAFELVNDCLRDYRFYKSDLIHPNDSAIQYVWEHLKDSYFPKGTHLLAEEVLKLHRESEHISLYQDSESDRAFRANFESKKKKLLQDFPEITWHEKSHPF